MSQLTKNSSLRIRQIFYDSSCEIQDSANLKKIGSAKEIHGLYYLELAPAIQNKACNSFISSACNNVDVTLPFHKDLLWHFRFGHLSPARLQLSKTVFPSIQIPKQHSCTVCPIAKQKRLPFPISHTLSHACFDLVHIDTWGPFRTPTIHGNSYFLTIVDDHSRFTWIYLLKPKGEVKYIIPNFHKYVSTQFLVPIKSVRTDNEAEFLLPNFYSQHGIVHQVSCVETPEQNGWLKESISIF